MHWTVRGKTGQNLSSNGQGRPRARAARGAPGPPVGDRPGARAASSASTSARVRRDIVALRDLGIPVEGERGRGGCYRLRPGYRVPPLMFTTGEAAAVALGLMAARRLGLEADGALAKVRRVLPDRVRLRRRVARAHARLHRASSTPRRPTARRCWRSPTPPAATAASTPATPTRAGVETARELSPYGLVAHSGRWYVPAFDHAARRPARAARRPLRPASELAGRGRAARRTASTPSPSSAARSPASPGRTRSRSSCTPTSRPPPRRFPPTLAELEPARRRHPPAPARRLARLGRRPARRRRLRLHRPRTRRELRAQPATRSPSGSRPPRPSSSVVGRHLLHRVHGAEERAAGLAARP